MRLQHLMLIPLITSIALAACNRGERPTIDAEKHLTVVGPEDGVKRFAKLQGSRRPALVVSPIKPLGSARAETTVTLPANYKGEDLVHTTREALAAGLDYKYEERRSVSIERS